MPKEQFGFESDKDKESGGHFFTTFQIVLICIVGACVIIAVGCMCALLPDRSCEPRIKPEPTVTEPRLTTLSPTPTEELWSGRLTHDLIPESYELYLKPYLYDIDLGVGDRIYTFDGRVKIHFRCETATTMVTLHMLNITIHESTLSDSDGNEVDIESNSFTPEYDFVHFHVAEELVTGTDYVLEIEYLGELWAGLSGFYRSSYEEDGETKWLAASQMQPTSARRALPCFDEPDFKAVFQTQIEHRNDMVALSNGIETNVNKSETDGWLITEYKATPIMSTYLLAFIVGYFNYTEIYTDSGIRFRVWSRPEAVNTTVYARDIGSNITTYYEKYFNISFPLEKQDMIAVPGLSFWAMENWGLITFQETALLYDSRVNSASNKQYVASSLSHELTHQWFGNLVTCLWWDDLWLNEGFASYVEGLGVENAEPYWGMNEQFVNVDLQPVFDLDALGTSHPVLVPVNSPDEINEIFDSISYSKGASILRMLNDILGEDVFVSGLNAYLITHRKDNAKTDDLWAALTEADKGMGDNDVKQIMDTWTLQMGFPVVDFRRIDDTHFNASQEHFLINPDAGVDDRYGDLGYLWYIFLTYTQKTDVNFERPNTMWIEKEPWALITLSSPMEADDWFLANIQHYGYYRVNYDNENWARLIQQLVDNHLVFPTENRAQLISDALTLARVGRVDYPIALDLTLYMENEEDYVPWEALLSVISYITDMFSRHYGYGSLERYMQKKVQTLYNDLQWNDDPVNDPHLTQFNRVNAIGTSCKYRNQDCLDQASTLFQEYMTNDANNIDNSPDYEINPISPNLKTTVYCYGIQEGGQEEWEFGWRKYKETLDAAEKSNWILALSYSQAPWILSRYLDYSLDVNSVRFQDSNTVIVYVSQNYIGRSNAWNYLRSNWETYKEYYGGSANLLSDIISDVTEDFNTDLELEELIAFGEGNNLGSATRAYKQAIEVTNTNIAWMSTSADTVADWFTDNAPAIGE
ncbi:aminopeptidase N-like [Strongylocentrotus purpuratus]|uniref:Aminopeptidase n=1 Tax=Strongylocentrotus purpuratus TaxID=7668 RepID=A0A7M7NT88_STRPU|nr:aminopeptidase N-like [Strongylocentrotus purpuratus]XP_030841205.1 aminopeptidase N-like [Strongylocentrotus purpuratus]